MGVWHHETCKGAEEQLDEGSEDSTEAVQGNATTVMRSCDYDGKMKEMLGIGTKLKTLQQSRVSRIEKKKWRSLALCKNKLRLTGSQPLGFYGLSTIQP